MRIFILMAALLFGTAHAQEVQVDVGLACDTAKQAEKFVLKWDGNWRTTLQKVNAEEGENACIVDKIAFVKGGEVARATNEQGTFAIFEVLVVGIATPQGMARIPPQVWYVLFKVKDNRV